MDRRVVATCDAPGHLYRGYDIRFDQELGVLCRHRNIPDVEVEAGHTPALLDVARKTIDFVLDNPNVDYRKLLGKQIVDYQEDDESAVPR